MICILFSALIGPTICAIFSYYYKPFTSEDRLRLLLLGPITGILFGASIIASDIFSRDPSEFPEQMAVEITLAVLIFVGGVIGVPYGYLLLYFEKRTDRKICIPLFLPVFVSFIIGAGFVISKWVANSHKTTLSPMYFLVIPIMGLLLPIIFSRKNVNR